MPDHCDLQIHVNGQHTFFVNEEIISKFARTLRQLIKKEKRRSQIRSSGIEIQDFPGGPEGFELVSRFCYNGGAATITVSNVSLLHCCAVFLGMSGGDNLLQQTETFLEGMFYWSWLDILTSLKSCEPFFSHADSCGLLQRLIHSLLAKIAQNSDLGVAASPLSTNSSFNSSPGKGRSPSNSCWWFEDMAILAPAIIEKFVQTVGGDGSQNKSLILTKFLLHYLKSDKRRSGSRRRSSKAEYGGLAETAVHGVIEMGKLGFSCRGLFSVLRIVGGLGVSRECRNGLERLIGGMIDEAKLDDLLVCGGGRSHNVYDISLVVRLVRLFVDNKDGISVEKMKKVGRLMDDYLGEIAPDHNLNISKFLRVAESLPDFARDTFDGVYRAIDIYLQSHPTLSLEERSRLCRCINYEKLSLEACKELAKNPRIPPRIAVQALVAQKPNISKKEFECDFEYNQPCHYYEDDSCSLVSSSGKCKSHQMVMYKAKKVEEDEDGNEEDEEDIMKINLQKMQWRVVELEKLCREMKGQMSSMVKGRVMTASPHNYRALPRLC